MDVVGVRWTTKVDHIPRMQKNLKELNGKKVQVGVFGEKAWLAGIHEYGCVITPGNAKYLTVPCNPKAKGKKASDFKDLFYAESKTGTKFLAIPRGKDSFEIMFILMTKVVIPERAFLRKGYDNNADKVVNSKENILKRVIGGNFNVETYLCKLGEQLASKIKKDARDLNNPFNSWTTEKTKGSSNPLVDTGEMIRSITYKVNK